MLVQWIIFAIAIRAPRDKEQEIMRTNSKYTVRMHIVQMEVVGGHHVQVKDILPVRAEITWLTHGVIRNVELHVTREPKHAEHTAVIQMLTRET